MSSLETLPPDPRLDSPATYSAPAVIASIETFYRSLPHISPEHIHTPPPGGWPSITKEALGKWNIHKTEQVVGLLRHLPYLCSSQPRIAPDARVIDYRLVGHAPDDYTTTDPNPGNECDCHHHHLLPPRPRHPPPWLSQLADNHHQSDWGFQLPLTAVQLTWDQHRGAACHILDTLDGTMSLFSAEGYVYPSPKGHYSSDDPRVWREACDEATVPVAELLREWTDRFRCMEWLGVPGGGEPGVIVVAGTKDLWWKQGEFEEKWLAREMVAYSAIFKKYGWPDNYRGEECRKAIAELTEEEMERYLEAHRQEMARLERAESET
ncbi:hypothetical protein JX265_001759 [Neoarthrinium moseri]|uniref:Uncharacterized protein n=1 Tax=Neoarthrinium moseri TaxID=1658444 RepID=A0A9P9WW20_9PEZI|nr:hypothetical protein JX265_001759 [Neoarthrinium moseri]